MTSIIFLAFVMVLATIIVFIVARFLTGKTARIIFCGLPLWLLYVGTLSYFGVVSNAALRPPGIVYILLPVFALVLGVLARSVAGLNLSLAFPLWVLTGLPVYRIGVELIIHQLYRQGLVPKMLTFEGSNTDIWIGVSAPLVAWIATRGRGGERVALVWNWLGIASLANIALRFAMTAPGPLHLLHTEVPNLAAGTFPYTFIPGFLAPLAVILHVLSIRGLRHKLSHRLQEQSSLSSLVSP